MNGVYSAVFATQSGKGTGTVYIKDSFFYGGDAAMAYWGQVEQLEGTLSASVQLQQHSDGYSVFGDAKELVVKGEVTGTSISGIATVPGTAMQGTITLKKIASL